VSRRTASRLATYEHGTYILRPTSTRPFRVITIDPVTGRQRERTAHTETEARELARRFEAFRAAGAVAPGEPTVADLAEATVEGLVTAGRTESYIEKVDGLLRVWVVPVIGDLRVDAWTPADSERVLGTAAKTVGKERQADLRRAMVAMVSRAQKLRLIPRGEQFDPLAGVKVVGAKGMLESVDRDRLPTIAECEKVELALAEVINPDWALGLRFTRESMVRWSELLALVPECFGFVGPDGYPLRSVTLSEAIVERKGRFPVKDLKNHSRRTTSFGAGIADELADLVARTEPGARLYTRPDGKTPDRSWWSRKMRKALLIAGFEDTGWTIHTWRHVGACTWLFDRDADQGAVSAALGHSNVAFTLAR
jgi:integrase